MRLEKKQRRSKLGVARGCQMRGVMAFNAELETRLEVGLTNAWKFSELR